MSKCRPLLDRVQDTFKGSGGTAAKEASKIQAVLGSALRDAPDFN